MEPGEDAGRLAAAPDLLVRTLLERGPTARGREDGPVRVSRAPGRVNLIGEHTDYNDGWVLPVAIHLGISIAFQPTDDRRVEVELAASGERQGFDLDHLPPRSGTWIDYVAGTAWALHEAGFRTRGFRGLLASDLPQGSGLSSSAALELASAGALLDDAEPADRMLVALAAQRGENEYVGVSSGLMDQFASAFGDPAAALLLDCRTLEHRTVPLPRDDVRLVVCDSGSPRRLEASGYNERRAQCEAAVAAIARTDPSVKALRDVTPALLERVRPHLDGVTFARAEHVVTENARVHAAVAAFEAGRLDEIGKLFAESHRSLRDRYEVSSPELDALVEIATATRGVIAARLTGAGFGGCTVNLVRGDAVNDLRQAVGREYEGRTGLVARVIEVEPALGAQVVDA